MRSGGCSARSSAWAPSNQPAAKTVTTIAGELDARPAAEKGDRTAAPSSSERERQRARGLRVHHDAAGDAGR